MDNEEPWQPPEQKTFPQVPQINPQVPELTLFSPSSSQQQQQRKKPGSNFLQRASQNNVLPTKPLQQNIHQNLAIANCVPPKPSVPDVSILADNWKRINANQGHQKSSSKENVSSPTTFQAQHNIPKASVPDVTILDEEPKRAKACKTSSSSDRVFNESYKKMMINSHEEFMRQIKEDSATQNVQPNDANLTQKRSGLFNKQQPVRYQENPLRKYAPKPYTQKEPQRTSSHEQDGNSSSILVDVDKIAPISNRQSCKESEEKSDEMTFRKVADMLSEIQKLVIPSGDSADKRTQNEEHTKPKKLEILKKLAQTYLTSEEYDFYEIEQELEELQNNDSGT